MPKFFLMITKEALKHKIQHIFLKIKENASSPLFSIVNSKDGEDEIKKRLLCLLSMLQ